MLPAGGPRHTMAATAAGSYHAAPQGNGKRPTQQTERGRKPAGPSETLPVYLVDGVFEPLDLAGARPPCRELRRSAFQYENEVCCFDRPGTVYAVMRRLSDQRRLHGSS